MFMNLFMFIKYKFLFSADMHMHLWVHAQPHNMKNAQKHGIFIWKFSVFNNLSDLLTAHIEAMLEEQRMCFIIKSLLVNKHDFWRRKKQHYISCIIWRDYTEMFNFFRYNNLISIFIIGQAEDVFGQKEILFHIPVVEKMLVLLT